LLVLLHQHRVASMDLCATFLQSMWFQQLMAWLLHSVLHLHSVQAVRTVMLCSQK
jgi:hypothetical protein